MLQIPFAANDIINRLNAAGFEAFLVGGCVRDALLKQSPQDWDVATSALPQEIAACFADKKVLETGLSHGTVTVLAGSMPIEVTTFRLDGEYSDHRHPNTVSFTHSLSEDLKRRDFTINAMAYHPQTGIIDPFDGQKDLNAQKIRCVGKADDRFNEDALRILRALRFSSVLGFSLETETKKSLHKNAPLLSTVSVERIYSELLKLLCGQKAGQVLLSFSDVFGTLIPALKKTVGFAQNTPYHIYNVYDHIAHSVDAIQNIPHLRLTMLLHDVGKPLCYREDEKHIGHFFGHAKIGAKLSKEILRHLHADKKTIERVCLLIRLHSSDMENSAKWVKRFIGRYGAEVLHELIAVKIADNSAKHPHVLKRVDEYKAIRQTLQMLEKEKACCTRSQLAINGNDLIKLGIPQGKGIGSLLAQLLELVVDGACENTHDALIAAARNLSIQKPSSFKEQ